MTISFYSFNLKDLNSLFTAEGLSPSVAGKLFNWHYKHAREEECKKDISKSAQEFIKHKFNFSLPTISKIQHSEDRTVKFLLTLQDGKEVETVLLPFQGKYSLCLSSQVGCAMKCSFCFTGMQGLFRNLKTEEIVGQFLVARQWLMVNRPEDGRIQNIVFMGQGEPLHNFDAVKTACEIFLSQHGLSIADHKITISTAGYLPGLKRWKDEMPDVNIALSLHSTDREKRNELIPLNKKYPLEEIIQFVDVIPTGRKRFVTFEYLLIKDFNDSEKEAISLGEFLKERKALINLIPFNPIPGSKYLRPEEKIVEKFKAILDDYKIPTMIRGTKGHEILAACGQLNSNKP
jgi:23S rRNA (adenine2503-C2)-methyltransferase